MKYKTVPPEDSEEDYAAPPPAKPPRWQHHYILYTLLALLLFINLALLLFINLALLASLHQLGMHLPLGHSSKLVPFLNSTLFEPHPNFESFAEADDVHWHKQLPPNGGVLVKEIDSKLHIFGIAMFHQLHCLENLRHAIQMFSNTVNGTMSLDEARERLDLLHVGHCVDYIRQSVLCSADDTVEQPKFGEFGGLDLVSGHDVVHQCRDKNAVWRMSEESGFADPDMRFNATGFEVNHGQ